MKRTVLTLISLCFLSGCLTTMEQHSWNSYQSASAECKVIHGSNEPSEIDVLKLIKCDNAAL